MAMEKSALIISNTNDFMFKVLTMGLKRSGIRFRVVPASTEALSLPGEDILLRILYLDESIVSDQDFLSALKDSLAEKEPELYLIGNDQELSAAKSVLPESSLKRIFRRPLNIHDLIGEILSSDGISRSAADRPQILIVDDDPALLRVTSRILSENYKTYMAGSGANAISFLSGQTVDLILMDIRMPEMNGFETLKEIRKIPGREQIPVIFLTGLNEGNVELQGLQAGAADFITKPFLPEVLRLRVKNYLELQKLRDDLTDQVEKKTQEVNRQKEEIRLLTLQIVEALSGTIDAKDKYTNGHSVRVGTYARAIAERAGFSEEDCTQIYMIGLLHDVGKIGVPDSIINKPDRLTDEEYAIIKTHPQIGADILKKISVLPHICDGARWHHERYDGKGYPDGLKGEEIPEIAQIIGVADAYDAMTSNRSYRRIMPQQKVREEIEKGMETQFSPRFARIMLDMIDEDTDYSMREGQC